DTEDTLALTLKQVEDTESELSKVTVDLDRVKLTLAEKEDDLAAQDQLLSNQAALLQEQEEYMKAASKEILELRGQMPTIAVLRLSILEQIRDSVVKVMGDASKVAIGENGNIILSEGILFDVGKSDIKPDSRAVLDQLIDVFSRFLSNSDNAKYVDSIVISGHTDSTGDESSNRELSTDRANSVLDYLLTGKNGALTRYAQYFCAAGYGETRPVESNDTDAGRAANRRIEVSMILKDESVLKIVEEYLALELPEVGAQSTPAP
ncbi:MAG: OmpA family protein, partial [Oscillospiraceae bacterium]|nr:OmpA family protein [Oscillospiraceae bacterium]